MGIEMFGHPGQCQSARRMPALRGPALGPWFCIWGILVACGKLDWQRDHLHLLKSETLVESPVPATSSSTENFFRIFFHMH